MRFIHFVAVHSFSELFFYYTSFIFSYLAVEFDFIRFHLIVILKQNVVFSFNIYSLTMTVISVETLEELK